ncbi:MAG: SpoIIE family protein phosphatase [Proteobacteria bacterium]|nr:SpoIIE family protein phosphatase [Pseudomonadota bacterium]
MKLRPLKDIHALVKLNYVGRLIIYSVEVVIFFSVFYHHKEPLGYWLLCLCTYLFWPTGAFLLASNSKDQKKAETNNIMFEAILMGVSFAVLKCDLWACLAVSTINLLFYTMIGGPKFFAKAVVVMVLIGGLSMYILPGFSPRLQSSVMTIVISIILILTSVIVMGISAYMTNIRLSKQRRALKEKQDQIVSSLTYARAIQNSLMAVPESIRNELPHSFVIWEPREIVGGDIYYTHFSEDEFVVSVIDCTGHGVPGALLSMMASSVLQRIVRVEKMNKPSEILKRLNHIVRLTLNQDSLCKVSDDGMDIAIGVVNKKTRRLTYAGARIPLLIIRNGKSEMIKGDKHSIGYRLSDTDFQYTDHEVVIEKGTAFYMFSDGITTQTGGDKNLMFGTTRLRVLLEDMSGNPFDAQRCAIMEAFNEYHSKMKRKDDITLFGFSLDDPALSAINN